MSSKFKVVGLIVTIFLLFAFLFNFAYGNPLLEVIPEKVIGVLELKDAELIESLSELDLAGFSPGGKKGSELQDYRMTREEIKEEHIIRQLLRKLLKILQPVKLIYFIELIGMKENCITEVKY